MLEKLYIENIAVIEKTEVNFKPGFTVLTGETGAGKSILIGSVNLLMGQRISKDLVRQGAKSAIVTAVFTNLCPRAIEILNTNGFQEEDNAVIITRDVGIDGKSTARINGKICAASVLKELSEYLVDIHGQHDNHFLLIPENHVHFLDEFADCKQELIEYQDVYHHALNLKKQLQKLQATYQEAQTKKDLLTFQISEIDGAQIKPFEDIELEKKRYVLQNCAKISESTQMVYNNLYGEPGKCASDVIGQSVDLLRTIAVYDSKLQQIYDKLFETQETVQDLSLEIDHFLNTFDFSESELEAIEERLSVLYNMRRKYGMPLDDILNFRDEIENELHSLEISGENISKIKLELSALQKLLHEKAQSLSKKRSQKAKLLDSKIAHQLSFLEMPKVVFLTDIKTSLNTEKTTYTANGCDKVEFLISTNAGEMPKPLGRIASGGELSRIMLALKSVLKSQLDTDTLIFDEIDSGVSGKAAQKIGMKMLEISQNKQVICVTHLSQIASLAQNHILIQKNVVENRASTSLIELDFDGRKQEIARIISGIDITDAALATAEELLTANQ